MKLCVPVLGLALLTAALAGAAPAAETGGAKGGPTQVEAKDLKTTGSGLKYAVLKPGKGPVCQKKQWATLHYTGWLQEGGKQFDSSRLRGKPFGIIAGGGAVIPGFDEGVLGMAVGEQRQIIIPPKLGYGEKGAGRGVIPPNSTLIFELELMELGAVIEPSAKPTKVDEKAIKTTASGLKYAIITEGKGAVADKGQQVTMHYTGWLKDGKKFDSSLDRGQSFQFNLGAGEVIKGWDEGVQGMKIGEKRQLIIPASLGYGAQGVGDGLIPPNSTLIFDVYLLQVD